MIITLLEDDPAQAEMLISWLYSDQHEVRHFEQGNPLREQLATLKTDLMILDWELPDCTGLDVLADVRHQFDWHVPVLFVTQRDAEADIVTALNSGADDYMVKQISRPEFLARISALSRRFTKQEVNLEIGPYHFLPESRRVEFNNKEIQLTSKEYDLALYMFQNLGRLLSRDQILKDIWNVSGLNTRTVDMHVSRVKKRLFINPDSGFRIKTIYQHGYRLESL